MRKKSFYANGKLLLTAEYFILDGAQALALPTKFGQTLDVLPSDDTNLLWRSYDANGSRWFEGIFDHATYDMLDANDETIGNTLSNVLKKADILSFAQHNKREPVAFHNRQILRGYGIETRLTFPREWGLGTSSTLIYNVAQLFRCSPFTLLAETFGGSGYDLACANAKKPIVYQRTESDIIWRERAFLPPFSENLYFIYLGKKQNSREGISRYREKANKLPPQYFTDISDLTKAFLKEKKLIVFEGLIKKHEEKVAEVLQLKRAKNLYFEDYWGEIKSLGAWGGDFVLATSDKNEAQTIAYFEKKGFNTILKYNDMIK
jgi:mevalonate kinase